MTDSPKHLLIVDDETAFREAIAERLADHGFLVEQAASGEQALERLAAFAFDILITDLRLPGVDGRQVLDAATERYPDIIAIVITGFGTVKDAVDAIKQGAADFITKPFQFDALLHVLGSALEQRRLRAENAYLRSELEQRYRIDGLVGTSRVMRDLYHLLQTVAPTSSTVLIAGETGTGKELAARALHHNSPRRANRFVALNCSAIPETLLEAELFGHVRGAFTGAIATRVGRLEQAHKGTLFLDEIGTMSPALQAKLLRVLQEREFERVGDSHTIKIDVRVIAATHSDLDRMVADGTFREDLFYRLNVIPVKLPPLRDRRDDIPLLVQHFLQKLCADLGRDTVTVSQDAIRRLMAYSWPGNVRQLENIVERALAFSKGRPQIDIADLGPEIVESRPGGAKDDSWLPDEGLDFESYIGGLELAIIRRSLEKTHGNKRQAAKLLNLKRTTLIEKLKRLEPRVDDSASKLS
jgi:two-component system response regulator PilR (NtrC family)